MLSLSPGSLLSQTFSYKYYDTHLSFGMSFRLLPCTSDHHLPNLPPPLSLVTESRNRVLSNVTPYTRSRDRHTYDDQTHPINLNFTGSKTQRLLRFQVPLWYPYLLTPSYVQDKNLDSQVPQSKQHVHVQVQSITTSLVSDTLSLIRQIPSHWSCNHLLSFVLSFYHHIGRQTGGGKRKKKTTRKESSES